MWGSILLGLAALSAAVDGTCFPDLPIDVLTRDAGAWLNIFTNLQFSCDGEVMGYEFYASKTGDFYVGVWRQKGSWWKYHQLVAQNKITVTKTGKQSIVIPQEDRLKARAGDMIGVHYKNSGDDGIIPYADSRDDYAAFGIKSDDLSKIINKGAYNLKNGHLLWDGTSSAKRLPALKPIINPGNVRLAGGISTSEGFAQVSSNGVFGTVCDDSDEIDIHGWPSTFCRQLGFHHAGAAHKRTGHGSIGLHRPRCTGYELVMSSCDVAGGACDHDSDVYIVCENLVKLEGGRHAGEGVAMFYNEDAHSWGSICDSSVSVDNWPQVLCKNLGYDHAAEAYRASSSYVDAMTGDISLHSPSCTTSSADDMVHCGSDGATCSHNNDVFVRCEAAVRLDRGNTPNEGLAMMYDSNKKWGSICDIYNSKSDWPSVFCKQLGYESCEYASRAKYQYTKQGSGHIAFKVPSCNVNNAASMLECGKDWWPWWCGHSNDIFVRCGIDDNCIGNPCQNGGLCVDGINDYTCQCEPGFSGYDCEIDDNECESEPCLNGGVCGNMIGDFECYCPAVYAGKTCDVSNLPKTAVVIRTYVDQNVGPSMHLTTKNYESVSMSEAPSPFQIVAAINGVPGAISFESVDFSGYYLRAYNGDMFLEKQSSARSSGNFKEDASFIPMENVNISGFYYFEKSNDRSQVLTVDGKQLTITQVQEGFEVSNHLFSLRELSAEGRIVLYQHGRFQGRHLTFTNDEPDLRKHGFNDWLSSFEVKGDYVWELYQHCYYKGRVTAAPPGVYGYNWVRDHIGNDQVSSMRRVQAKDSIVLWQHGNFRGTHRTLLSDDVNLHAHSFGDAISSIEIMGPSSWEVYQHTKFGGTKILMAPGRYNIGWIRSNIGNDVISSVRKVAFVSEQCGLPDTVNTVTGKSGAQHQVEIVHRADNSVWMKFGKGDMGSVWNAVNEYDNKHTYDLISQAEIDALKDFDFIDFEVESDLLFYTGAEESWHPSKLNVMYLGGKQDGTLKFDSGSYSRDAHITFSANYKAIECESADGGFCSRGNLPQSGSASDPLIVKSLTLDPRGSGAWALSSNGKYWNRNKYSFTGSHYYLYAKISDCEGHVFIPDYMGMDIYTRNVTGCPCEYDSTLMECACCEDLGCQCPQQFYYQCARCGYEEDKCGHPSVQEESHEYTFEYTDMEVTSAGFHFEVPEMCVTKISMQVSGVGEASEVIASLTDWNDRRRLSCTANTKTSDDPIMIAESEVEDGSVGVPINRVNVYAFGGIGQMTKLTLTINPDGCQEARDNRYVGCFVHDADEEEIDHALSFGDYDSSHMTRESCIVHCSNLGYQYAALKTGTECTCGNELPGHGPAYDCDISCPGDVDQSCGGTKSFSVYFSKEPTRKLFVASAIDGCAAIGGEFVSRASLKATAYDCAALGGQANSLSADFCDIDWCMVTKVISGAMYPSRPGSCGSRFVAAANIETRGSDCVAMGGWAGFGQSEWGFCQLDFCVADHPDATVFAATQVGTCFGDSKVGYGIIENVMNECRKMGGAVNGEPLDDERVKCHLDFCLQEASIGDDAQTFEFPNTNVHFEAGSSHEYEVEPMCVNECEGAIAALTDDAATVSVKFFDEDGQQVALNCNAAPFGQGVLDVLSFSDPPTGVKVAKIVVSSVGSSAELKWLRLRLDNEGCNAVEDAFVLYEAPNFGGKPHVFRGDIASLAELDNTASAIRIIGGSMWQLFGDADFSGKSVVLQQGEFSDSIMFPFGDNQLSSLRRVENIDIPRSSITGAHGIVTFERKEHHNAVWGLIPSPRTDERPRTFYFGDMTDADVCEQACRAEAMCAAWTLHTAHFHKSQWAGQCYGRGFHETTDVAENDIVSGFVASHELEDTITLFSGPDFTGEFRTIIENVQTFTAKEVSGYSSLLVTGSDNWRVYHERDGHTGTDYATPGEVGDITTMIQDGVITEIEKLHPHTQNYDLSEENVAKLAPVALSQIEQSVVSIDDKLPETCETTDEADILFMLDSSGRIGSDGFSKVKEFAKTFLSSLNIGSNNVRVGVIIFGSREDTHVAIELGQYTTAEDIMAAIDNENFMAGGRHHEEAFIQALPILNDNVRPGVARILVYVSGSEAFENQRMDEPVQKLKDAGVTTFAIGIQNKDGAAQSVDLLKAAGDASRSFTVESDDQLAEEISSIAEDICYTAVEQKIIRELSLHSAITLQGDDESYFLHVEPEFQRTPNALGMESGLIRDDQIFASSALFQNEPGQARLNQAGGWSTELADVESPDEEWVEVDLGNILAIHGIGIQGHATKEAWVTKFKMQISLDSINFVTLMDSQSGKELFFIGNEDQNTVKHHCLHRIFGQAIKARVLRIIPTDWETDIGLRFEVYGFRDFNDPHLLEGLKRDVWTKETTGCACYYDPTQTDCACCEPGGCQCPSSNKHQCVQCGYANNCGEPYLRDTEVNVDAWTKSMTGCRCSFDPLRMDCACCQNFGCQCGELNKNQCVTCGHPEHCGEKEHVFGPNSYCEPKTCLEGQEPLAEETSPVQ